MEQLTDEQLNEIEARANAAAPGPWTISEYRHYDSLEGFIVENAEGHPISWSCDSNDDHCGMMEKEVADFIAAARTDVPALVAEVRRLQAAFDGLIKGKIVGDPHSITSCLAKERDQLQAEVRRLRKLITSDEQGKRKRKHKRR